jgi:CDP-glucose 4,6-dehydratase
VEKMVNDNFWRDKNIFITGATGFLGSWVAKSLIEKNANVITLVRDKFPKCNFFLSGLDKHSTQVHGQLEDYHFIERVLNEYEVDTVFHMAAQTIVQTANRSPIGTFKSNIEGTWNIMEATRNAKLIKRVVVASSDKAYGTQPQLPYTEEMSLQGEHPYDVSKSCADLISQSYHKTYGLPVAVTRCANLYGGGDLNYNRLIPGIIKAIIQKKDFIIRSDGSMQRDYMYVKDGVDGYLKLGEKIDNPQIKGKGFNFGTETPLSVIDVFRKVKQILNTEINEQILGEAKGEIDKQYLGTQKVKELLNWYPQHTFEQGVKETFDWYNHFKNEVIN